MSSPVDNRKHKTRLIHTAVGAAIQPKYVAINEQTVFHTQCSPVYPYVFYYDIYLSTQM